MPTDLRTSTVARIGRSYPRHPVEAAKAEPSSIGRYQVTAALIALVSALGLIGWFLAR
jgi:hypothetical protein